jgi:hypothetical protein
VGLPFSFVVYSLPSLVSLRILLSSIPKGSGFALKPDYGSGGLTPQNAVSVCAICSIVPQCGSFSVLIYTPIWMGMTTATVLTASTRGSIKSGHT